MYRINALLDRISQSKTSLMGHYRFHSWDGFDEFFGVVVLRVVEELFCFAVLYDFSSIHDGNVIS